MVDVVRQGRRRPDLDAAEPGARRHDIGVVHGVRARRPRAAVDGFPINEPIWGTLGFARTPPTAYEINFGQSRTVDEVRLYFRDDRAGNRYRAPSSYTVQYWNGSAWVNAAAQIKTPAAPRANYNQVGFTPVSTQRLRVQFTHASGFKTGLTEIKVHNRGGGSDPGATVATWRLAATPSASYTSAVGERGGDQRRCRPAVVQRHRQPALGHVAGTPVTQWAELTWTSAPMSVRSAQVYFFDDNQGIDVPGSWKLQYWNGSAYVERCRRRAGIRSGSTNTTQVTVRAGEHHQTAGRAAERRGLRVGLLEVKAFS